jgi:hypothetical protein
VSERRDDEKGREQQQDRFTYGPGDLELVDVGDGPPISIVEEERRKDSAREDGPSDTEK